jgi:hypothetical protein
MQYPMTNVHHACGPWHALFWLLCLVTGTVLQLADGSSMRCDVVVGADGANSMVAQHLGLQQPNYAGYVAYRCEKTVALACMRTPRCCIAACML